MLSLRQISHENTMRFAEVIYYFNLPVYDVHNNTKVALVKMFKAIDPEWYRCSHGTYCVCREGNVEDLLVIPVKQIRNLVGMVPDPWRGERMFCIVQKPGCSAV
jgi:hypothetical protein